MVGKMFNKAHYGAEQHSKYGIMVTIYANSLHGGMYI